MAKKIKVDIEAEALSLVNNFVTTWKDATIDITSRVRLDVRKLIEKCRKNYYGVFDSPYDSQTGREKTFIPLTETTVESIVKNIDMDAKDINFRKSKTGLSSGTSDVDNAKLVRQYIKDYLYDTNFGQRLDETERQLAIDGTRVWKTLKNGNKDPETMDVELLNFYIDPTAKSIQDTPAVVERLIVTCEEFEKNKDYINQELAVESSTLHPYDPDLTNQTGDRKYVELWEYYGKMPKSLMTGSEKDKEEEVDGHIVISKAAVHLVELNTNKDGKGNVVKPYEEAWYIKVAGRWYGKGVAEMLLPLQVYLNTIVNIRITRSYLSQMGLFKIRKGAGITPQMLSRLAVNGGIEVNQQDDIEQFVMNESSSASYNDEANIWSWTQRLTSTYEIATGEKLPSGTTATVGSIQSNSAMSQFVLIKEGIGHFLQRWMDRHILPNCKIKKGYLMWLSDLEESEYTQLIENIVNNQVARKAKEGKYRSMQEAMFDKQALIGVYSSDKNIPVSIDEDIKLSDFECKVVITNEDLDTGVMVNNLIQMMSYAPQYADVAARSALDLMGISLPSAKPNNQQIPPEILAQMQKPAGGKSALGMSQEANTM